MLGCGLRRGGNREAETVSRVGKAKAIGDTRQARLARRIVGRIAKCAQQQHFREGVRRAIEASEGQSSGERSSRIRIGRNNLRIGSEKANWQDHSSRVWHGESSHRVEGRKAISAGQALYNKLEMK